MRAVIYARYSSENQREASIEDQVRVCKSEVEKRGLALAQTYTDYAISGATLLRPGIQALIEDSHRGRFDFVVAEALDRISRDQEDVAGLFKRLSFAGIKLITLSEGEITELHVGLKGTMNALFLKDLADKTRRGLRGRIEAGRSGGGNSYGYDVVVERRSDGTEDRGLRRINAEQASVITRIFTDYAKGKSPRAIAFDLNAEGIQGPSGVAWGPSTINGNANRGTGILNNELYVGKLVWNRLRYAKDPETGKRVSRLNSEAKWIVHDVPEMEIVHPELWQAVKHRQKLSHRNTRPDLGDEKFWNKRRPRFLLSGRMKCGACGAGFVKISQNLFGCASARNKGTCTNRNNIRQDELEAIVLQGLKSNLMEPQLFQEFAAEFMREMNRLTAGRDGERKSHEREFERIRLRNKRIVDAVADGAEFRPFKEELNRLEDRRQELERLLAAPERKQPLFHPNLPQIYKDKVADLHKLLGSDATRDDAFDAIRELIEEVKLTPDGSRLQIDITGEIAGILALCAEGRKTAKATTAESEQIKMVAGLGFEPRTFRL